MKGRAGGRVGWDEGEGVCRCGGVKYGALSWSNAWSACCAAAAAAPSVPLPCAEGLRRWVGGFDGGSGC
jgi:hypothetical protein